MKTHRPAFQASTRALRLRALVATAILLYLVVEGLVAGGAGERVRFLARELAWWEYGLFTAAVALLVVVLWRRWRRAGRPRRRSDNSET